MGAAAGHINHLYEDQTLSFGEIIKIFNNINRGTIPAYEKVDGQNLMITVNKGQLCGARNKTQLKNPITIDQVPYMFDKYPHVRESFTEACKILYTIFAQIGIDKLNKVFIGGTKYLNIEIVNNQSKNVINYGEPKIIFNNLCTVTAEGNIIGVDVDAANDFYNSFIDIFEANSIYPPLLIDIPNDDRFTQYLDYFKTQNVLDLNEPLGDLHKFSKDPIQSKINVDHFITKIGSKLLNSIKSNISNTEITHSEVKTQLAKVIDLAKGDPSVILKIQPHLDKIHFCGGITTFTPMEGIVFYYKNKIFKITGLFAPINQIIGLIKYSR